MDVFRRGQVAMVAVLAAVLVSALGLLPRESGGTVLGVV